MALLKVKGELRELLSLSQAAMAKKRRLEIIVRFIDFILLLFNFATSKIYCIVKHQEIRNTKERIQLLKKWKEEVQESLETSNLPA